MKLPPGGDVVYLTVLFKYFAQLFVFNQFTGPMRAVDVRQDHVQGARRANHILFSGRKGFGLFDLGRRGRWGRGVGQVFEFEPGQWGGRG